MRFIGCLERLVVSANSSDTWQALTLSVRATLSSLRARGILSAIQHPVRLCPITVHPFRSTAYPLLYLFL